MTASPDLDLVAEAEKHGEFWAEFFGPRLDEVTAALSADEVAAARQALEPFLSADLRAALEKYEAALERRARLRAGAGVLLGRESRRRGSRLWVLIGHGLQGDEPAAKGVH